MIITITGCSSQAGSNTTLPGVASSTGTPLTSEPRSPSADGQRDDLARGEVQKNFKSGDLTVNVTYSTTLSTRKWTPSVSKPVTVSLSAINNAKDTQKIYLARVRVAVVASDDNGPIGNPTNLVDTSNINPGFLVNFPYTYEQNFTIPAVDDGAESVTLTFNYELLPQVDKADSDYTKQTATSTIKVPLT